MLSRLSRLKCQFAFLLLAAVLLRGGTLVTLAPSLEADPDGYRRLSESLAVDGVFGAVDASGKAVPTAFRPPAYPWLLSWWVQDGRLTASAVAWFHGILGVATVCLTFWLGRRLFALRDPSDVGDGSSLGKGAITDVSDKRPLLAGLFVAADPILLVQSAQVMTETFATFLAVAAWAIWLWLVSRATTVTERAVAGILLASILTVAFFSRPAFLVWAVLLIVWLIGLGILGSLQKLAPRPTLSPRLLARHAFLRWKPKKTRAIRERGDLGVASRPASLVFGQSLKLKAVLETEARRRQRDFLIVAALVVLMLGGVISWWTERNRREIGHPVWATSHGGYTLLLGNNPLFYDYVRSMQFGQAWQAEPFHRAWSHRYDADPFADDFWKRFGREPMATPIIENEVADDRLAYDVAMSTIRQQPTMFVWSSMVRLGNLWSPLPHVTDHRPRWQVWGIGGFYFVVTAFVLVGMWSLRWQLLSSPWIAGLLLAVALTAVHAVYWSNLRMRAPAVPWLSLLAAAGVGHWVKLKRSRREQVGGEGTKK